MMALNLVEESWIWRGRGRHELPSFISVLAATHPSKNHPTPKENLNSLKFYEALPE
jgi:hypothetical protein